MGYLFQRKVLKKLNQIQMDVTEAIAKLNATADQLDKVKTEVQALKDLASGMTGLPTELVDAINRVGTSTQAVDDINPDAVG